MSHIVMQSTQRAGAEALLAVAYWWYLYGLCAPDIAVVNGHPRRYNMTLVHQLYPPKLTDFDGCTPETFSENRKEHRIPTSKMEKIGPILLS